MPDSLDRLTTALANRYVIERGIGSGGMATVYLTFVLASGLYEDSSGNVDETNLWREWDNVSELHRFLYGDDIVSRGNQYIAMSQ